MAIEIKTLRVSIIMPAWNAAQTIGAAVESVLLQDMADWELIVVDDGSTDGTPALLAAFDDPRIRVISQKNAGVSVARNRALDMAQGLYVTFLDADDALPHGALRLRADLLDARPDADFADGAVSVRDANLEQELRVYTPQHEGPLRDRLIALDETAFFNVCYMVRAAAIGSTRFQTGLSHCEDLLFHLKIANSRSALRVICPEVVYLYRSRPGSAMSNLAGLESGYDALITSVKEMDGISPAAQTALRRRVRRIMVRSWLRRGRFYRALRAGLHGSRGA